jgi:hypothetical protein
LNLAANDFNQIRRVACLLRAAPVRGRDRLAVGASVDALMAVAALARGKKSCWLEVADSYRTTTPRVFAFDESESDQAPHLRACSDTLIAIGLAHAAMANFGRGSQLLNFGQSSQLLENAEATSTDRRSDDRKSH